MKQIYAAPFAPRYQSTSSGTRVRVLAFIVSCLCVSPLLAQVQFERISLAQGLSQTSVFSIVQDEQGFMWFGTQDGLNKYDGYQFTVYRRDAQDTTSLSDNYVTVLFRDSRGTLWIGTRGGGLNRFDHALTRFTHYRFRQDDPSSLSNDQVTSICEDHDGNLWIGTSHGLNKMDRTSGRCMRFAHSASDPTSLPNDYVQSVFIAPSGTLWVGMIDAAASIDPHSVHFVSIPSSPFFTLYNGFLEDRSGTIWALTTTGLARYVPAQKMFRLEKSGFSGSIAAHGAILDETGTFWIGADKGLFLFNPNHASVQWLSHRTSDPASLSGDYILSVFQDAGGVYWIGTYEGINKYSPRKNRFRQVLLNPSEAQSAGWNKVRGFSEDRSGTVWVATQEGLMTYRPQTNILKTFSLSYPHPNTGTNLLWSVLSGQSSGNPTVWLGTNGRGLVKIAAPDKPGSSPRYMVFRNRPGDFRSLSGDAVLAMVASQSHTLWIGTLLEGLDLFNPDAGTFTRFRYDAADSTTLSHNEVWSLYEDPQGTLWAGTAGGGLNRLTRNERRFTRYFNDPANPKSLTDNKVTALYEGKDGVLWIGTYAGLNRFDAATGTFDHFTVRDGLPNDVVYGILGDDHGNLWISTNKGLSRFTIGSGAFRNFDVGDGLQSNEFNQGAALRLRDGEMLFGGINGFNIFNPDSVYDNPVLPQVVITDVKVFNQSIIPGNGETRIRSHISRADTLFLSYRDDMFSFNFAALEFTNPSKNKYAYRMMGFDDQWRYVGSKREATYTNLDPGTYTFRVKASNNDGLWNETGTSLTVLVAPPFWLTWWFRSLLIAAFLGIGPAIYFRRVNRLQRERGIQERFSRQLLEEQERERQRIAGELHDSLGQDLLVIKNRASLGLRASGRTRKAKEQFEEISSIVSRTLQDVRRLSHNLRPYQLDRLGLSDSLNAILQSVQSSSDIRITSKIERVDHLLPAQEEINIFRIVQEGINNILKHSEATEAEVQVRRSNGSLLVRIQDNGRGFSLSQIAGPASDAFGLTGINQRVQLLGGTASIDSIPGRGTTIEITIPLRKEVQREKEKGRR